MVSELVALTLFLLAMTPFLICRDAPTAASTCNCTPRVALLMRLTCVRVAASGAPAALFYEAT